MSAEQLQLRERITAALDEAQLPLGTATLANGETTPAINCGDWPDGTTVTGLEVLIGATPRQRALDAFVFLGFVNVHSVRLIAWEGAPDLEDVANTLAEAFWPLDQDPQVLPENDLMPEQVLLAITLQD